MTSVKLFLVTASSQKQPVSVGVCFTLGRTFSKIIRSFRRFKIDFRYTRADNLQKGLTETYRHTKISQYHLTGKENSHNKNFF